MGAGAGRLDEEEGCEARARQPEDEHRDAGERRPRKARKALRPAPDEGDALRQHEGESLGDRGGRERGDERGHLQHGDGKPIERARQDADREPRADRQQHAVARMNDRPSYDGREARYVGDREIELGGQQCEREADRQDGEQRRLLADVQEVGGAREIRRHDEEEADQRRTGGKSAKAFEVCCHSNTCETPTRLQPAPAPKGDSSLSRALMRGTPDRTRHVGSGPTKIPPSCSGDRRAWREGRVQGRGIGRR
ncbi:MAG TPA: hypothetical protein PK264_23460 [Hyphomicrobiaceae bacterium]|nr:hypothetical protein [Hyphomicrobiaceae bacterium]